MGEKLGQVFLKEKTIIEKIIRYSNLNQSDHVIEIGCGAGILTEGLAKSVQQLTVIELDPACIAMTKERLAHCTNIHYIHSDVLKVDFSQFGPSVKIVANIPYYLSAKLIQHLVPFKPYLADIVIMIQKEFAGKLTAPVGTKAYTSLSVYSNFHFELSKLFDISKRCFTPVPKIDSTMIRLIPKSDTLDDMPLFEDILKAAFWARRKKLMTALKKNPHRSFNIDFSSLTFFKEHPDFRAENLSLTDFISLYKEVKSLS